MRPSFGVTLAVLFAGLLLGSIGHALLSSGMRIVGSPRSAGAGELLAFAGRTLREPRVLAGFTLQVAFFASYVFALARADLSVVLPITALDYLVPALLALLVLRERFTWERWLGIALITAGVVLVARSAPRGAEGNWNAASRGAIDTKTHPT